MFPHTEGYTKPDPTKPISTWRTAWRRLTREAGLKGLRFHDLRHHAITELAESDEVSEQTIMAIAGHVSPRMLRHYSHVRQEAKRKALDALSGRRAETKQGASEGGYGTTNATNPTSTASGDAQLVDKAGGADGIRTHDLLDAIEARSQLRHGPTVR